MKITIGAILILCASAAFDGIAAVPPCNTTAFSKLLVTTNVRTCHADSGYNPTSMTKPTDAQIDAVCNSKACTQVVNAVKQVAPHECTIGSILLYGNVIDPLKKRCGKSSGSAGSVSASASGSGPSVGDVGSASDSVAGSAAGPSVGDKPHTTSPHTGSPTTARGNGGADAPTLSTCAAIAVAAVVAAIL